MWLWFLLLFLVRLNILWEILNVNPIKIDYLVGFIEILILLSANWLIKWIANCALGVFFEKHISAHTHVIGTCKYGKVK